MTIETVEAIVERLTVELCAEHGIAPVLLNSTEHRSRRVSAIRGELIRKLDEIGFAQKAIGRLLNMSQVAVGYHLYPNLRDNSLERRKRNHRARR
jgi:hypothetical protein